MENIPCRWLDCWTENQSPLGSGEYWPMRMSECGNPNENYGDECSPNCSGYEPMEVAICDKHGEFIKESGCDGCMAEDLGY